ncbi:MAG: DUF4097 family beta strand repeat-containing protein [Acidobacteriota bacterium]
MRLAMRLAAVALAAALFSARSMPGAEVTKTLRAQLPAPDLSRFAVENLAGTMRIEPGAEGAVTVVATIHAESQKLADAVRLERVVGRSGTATLRVRYPASVRTIRYRAPLDEDAVSINLGLDLFSSSTYHYDGRIYHVASGHGRRLWADLEVHVPPKIAAARFKNLAGLVEADGVEGNLSFDVASADLRLRRLGGELALHGSSGDIRASDIRGGWKSDFSSGDCEIDGFDGDILSVSTSSGDVRARGVRARRVELDTSSGDASFQDADIEEFRGKASSGDLALEAVGSRLKELSAHTSSGDVALRLPGDASFDASADQSSGDMAVGFSDGTPTRRHDKLVGYRRGTDGARIRVETSSGDLAISPK